MTPRTPLTRLLPLVLVFAAALSGCATTTSQSGIGASPQPKAANKLAEVQTQLGIGYLRENKPELAYDRLTKALAADPNYSTAHNAMGTLQERLGDMASAEAHYKTAVSLSPRDSSAQSNFGSFLCRTGRYEEGEQRFLQALKNSLYERPEVAYNNAGICMRTAGEMEKAETYFRAALERNPRIPSALEGMAEISFSKQKFLPARAYLQRYEELAPLDASTLWLGTRIERELGDNAAAERYATLLRRQFPDSREARLLEDTQ